jgi:hypothetical protein
VAKLLQQPLFCARAHASPGDNSINQAWDEVFTDVPLLPFPYNSPTRQFQNSFLVCFSFVMPLQVAPPARTSIGVKELPLGR